MRNEKVLRNFHSGWLFEEPALGVGDEPSSRRAVSEDEHSAVAAAVRPTLSLLLEPILAVCDPISGDVSPP